MKPNAAYESLTLVIDQMTADTLDRNTIESLRNMLDLDAFQPIRDVVEKKIIEVGNYLKSKESPPPAPAPIEVWMGVAPKKQVESNEALREEIEDLLNSPPYEYENESDPRGYLNQVKDGVGDTALDFDITLDALDPRPRK
jgi:hypothetical protein